ncbi:MAG: hypothetical protein NZU63_03300 [Gemmataceae bacterium]|nr:hypothetical protein [Gemmataceae bacterium]MDW8243882.1 hypothetical protein [Thermogemmata sp.]
MTDRKGGRPRPLFLNRLGTLSRNEAFVTPAANLFPPSLFQEVPAKFDLSKINHTPCTGWTPFEEPDETVIPVARRLLVKMLPEVGCCAYLSIIIFALAFFILTDIALQGYETPSLSLIIMALCALLVAGRITMWLVYQLATIYQMIFRPRLILSGTHLRLLNGHGRILLYIPYDNVLSVRFNHNRHNSSLLIQLGNIQDVATGLSPNPRLQSHPLFAIRITPWDTLIELFFSLEGSPRYTLPFEAIIDELKQRLRSYWNKARSLPG